MTVTVWNISTHVGWIAIMTYLTDRQDSQRMKPTYFVEPPVFFLSSHQQAEITVPFRVKWTIKSRVHLRVWLLWDWQVSTTMLSGLGVVGVSFRTTLTKMTNKRLPNCSPLIIGWLHLVYIHWNVSAAIETTWYTYIYTHTSWTYVMNVLIICILYIYIYTLMYMMFLDWQLVECKQMHLLSSYVYMSLLEFS